MRHGALTEGARALAALFGNPSLLWLETARAASTLAIACSGVVFAVLAYRAGGVAAVSLLAVVGLLTIALASPFVSLLGDRLPRRELLLGVELARAAVLVAAAGVAGGEPSVALVTALAGCFSLLGAVSGPARAALAPSLARTPHELAAANVVATTSEDAAGLAGPALAGALLAVAAPDVAFAVSAVALGVAVLFVARAGASERPERVGERERTPLGRALAGFTVALTEPRARLVLGLYAVQSLAVGVLGVAVVPLAIDLLDLGEGGLGLAGALLSAGGLAGAAATLVVVGWGRLATGLGAGLVLWGAAVALTGAWPEPAIALALLAAAGAADTLVDVTGVTLLQRTVPDAVLARVFGAAAGILFGAAVIGAVAAAPLIETVGLRWTLLGVGLATVLSALLAGRQLRRLDRAALPSETLALLRSVPFLGRLPAAVVERLAAGATRAEAAAGTRIFRQGEEGHSFYVVAAGTVEIDVDGRREVEHGPGEFFGEIALLREVPRSATATASRDAVLSVLERAQFLEAVTSHELALELADAVVAARLRRRPG